MANAKKYSIEERFRSAVEIVHSLPKEGPIKPSISDKLKYYSLYKQATEGPCNIPKPGFWNVIESYKWGGWKNLGDMSKEEAMERYVDGMCERMDQIAEVYDTGKWMEEATEKAPEKLAEMSHHFEVIGRPYSHYGCSMKDEQPPTRSDEDKENSEYISVSGEDFDRDQKKAKEPQYSSTVLSDNEYCDAEDTLQDVSTEGESEEAQPSGGSTGVASTSCARRRRHASPNHKDALKTIRGEINQLATQISRLTQLLETRYSAFNTLLQQISQTRQPSPKTSRVGGWLMMLLFIWPIVFHYFMKYRQILKYLPQLIWYRLTS